MSVAVHAEAPRLLELVEHSLPVRALNRVVTDRVDLARMGQANLELLARGMKRHLSGRSTIDPQRIIDVYYDDLIADPISTVRRICEWHELPFSSPYEQRLGRFVRENPQHKHGTHRYSTDDFGLTASGIAERFSEYISCFPRLEQGRH